MKIRVVLYICALVHTSLYAEQLKIAHSGNYQIRYVNNSLALVDCDNEQRIYNLQAAIQSGGFSLPANITNQFIIAADNVSMDLSGHTVQGGIVIAPNKSDIVVRNGLIGGKFSASLIDGIRAYAGCRNITINDMQISNAITGINFDSVENGLIANCDLVHNTTGLLLQNSSQITVDNARAYQNISAGFSLVSSYTNCLRDCKALGTGHNNVQTTDTEIFGFVATNGDGNVFENCIANSTQGLNVTDYDSLIAGFALRGTEGCSKIIACEAANCMASGVNVPYGILLEGRFDTPLTLTGSPPVPTPSTGANSLGWTSDGKYIVIADGDTVAIYTFDRQTGILSRVASAETDVSFIPIIDWHPNNRLLAVGQGGTSDLPTLIYEFCPINNTLTRVATQPLEVERFRSLAWHPSGNFLAIGEGLDASNVLYIYRFDVVSNSLELLGSQSFAGDQIKNLDWSPDGDYIAVNLDSSASEVYSFDPSSSTPFIFFTTLISYANSDASGGLAWSPDGKYVVNMKGGTPTMVELEIFLFDDTGAMSVESVVFDAGVSFDWSSDSRYLVITYIDGVEVYEFDRDSQMLTAVPGTLVSGDFGEVRWSPDGEFFVFSSISTPFLGLYEALTFPSKNVIKDNVVYCNANNDCGIGISGSSIANLIIGNTAYSNPTSLPEAGVGTNYAFVQNIFDQRFGQGPTALQNISVVCNEAICTPDDLALIVKQIKSKLCGEFISSLELIQAALPVSSTQLDGVCGHTPIAQSDIPTNLNTSGVYCLDEDVSNAGTSITISTDNVVLDLNNHKITNSSASTNAIDISGLQDSVTIKNGAIEHTAGSGLAIDGTDGITNFVFEDLIIKMQSGVGIDVAAADGGVVRNCIFDACQQGIRLTDCANITCEKTQAKNCILKGFELIRTSTSCFKECKALSTGVGNAQTTDQIIAGFFSNAGLSNIFENCIANGTQGLAVTDVNSVVAGFMLTGTEQCSKIINCEASNSMVGPASYTTPYGILLDYSFDQLYEMASSVAQSSGSPQGIQDIKWSPNGRFVAVVLDSNSTEPTFWVLEFDRVRREFQTIANFNREGGLLLAQGVSWSPDGNYIAVDSGYLQIYKFDQESKLLTLIIQENVGEGGTTFDELRAIAWSPDGRYLAVGGDNAFDSTIGFHMYEFDRVQQTLTQRATIADRTFRSVDWTPDGTFIALGADSAAGSDLFVYEWDRINNQLIEKDSKDVGDTVYEVNWSHDGRYLVAAEGSIIRVYELNKTTGEITSAAVANPPSSFTYAATWSADGRYIATGSSTGFSFYIYEFDRENETLTAVSTLNPGGNSSQVFSTAWDPAGDYIAVGRWSLTTTAPMLFMYSAFDFPQKCVIKDNVVYCNSGGIESRGIGISGSSISNLIIGNTAYSNPSDPFMVNENYQFVTNGFSTLFGNKPSLLVNISIGCNQPICIPDNEAFLAKQLLAKVDDLSDCAPTFLQSSDVVSGTISLTQEGTYCLTQDVTADISITATCVSLDLNDRIVTGVIEIAATDNVRVENGFVKPAARTSNAQASAAVNIDSGCVGTLVTGLNIECENSTGDAIVGRFGILDEGIQTIIEKCIIVAGNASSATSMMPPGASGGHGIQLASSSSSALIRNCVIISSGRGGNVSMTGAGGAAGHGVHVNNAFRSNIESIIVFATGNGGSGYLAVGGDGGNGIKVESGSVAIQIFNCVFRNTGTAGTGGTNGKAIDDDVAAGANETQAYSNFAHNIANTTIRYDLQAAGSEQGVNSPNPPDGTVINFLANVYTT